MYQKITVSQEVRDLVEALFWILQKRPEEITTAATKDSYTIINLNTDNRLDIEVKE